MADGGRDLQLRRVAFKAQEVEGGPRSVSDLSFFFHFFEDSNFEANRESKSTIWLLPWEVRAFSVLETGQCKNRHINRVIFDFQILSKNGPIFFEFSVSFHLSG